MVNTASALKFTPPCKLASNAVFTIFAFNCPLVCTFLHHIYTEKICVNTGDLDEVCATE